MQINVLPTGILDQEEDFCAVCLGSEKFPFEPVTVLSEIAANLINVMLAFYGNIMLKGVITKLGRVITDIKLSGEVWHLLAIPILRDVVIHLFTAVCNDLQI